MYVNIDSSFQNKFIIFFPALEELKNHLENPENIVEMKFLLLEQKYLELISKRSTIDALKVNFKELQKILLKFYFFLNVLVKLYEKFIGTYLKCQGVLLHIKFLDK